MRTLSNGLERLNHVARQRGGRCLAERYVNQRTAVPFVCAHGHHFESDAIRVLRKGCWCPHCAGNARHELSVFQDWARTHGGECLSTEYRGNKVALRYRCAAGHEFSFAPIAFHTGRGWCTVCRRREEQEATLEALRIRVEAMGYRLLSTQYVNARTPLLVRCDRDHDWWVRPDGLVGGRRCAHCRARQPRPETTRDGKRARWPALLETPGTAPRAGKPAAPTRAGAADSRSPRTPRSGSERASPRASLASRGVVTERDVPRATTLEDLARPRKASSGGTRRS